MPQAVGAFLGVVGVVGSAIYNVASSIGAVILNMAEAIGTAMSLVATTIGSTLGNLVSSVFSSVKDLASFIGKTIGGAVGFIGDTVGGIAGDVLDSLGEFVSDVWEGFSEVVTDVAENLDETITGLGEKIEEFAKDLNKEIEFAFGKTMEAPNSIMHKILTPINKSLKTVKTVVDAINEPIEAITAPIKSARELIQKISSFKIVEEILKGEKDVLDFLYAWADDETNRAITEFAELYRDITGSTVAIIDRIDIETDMLWTTIDTFEETLKSSAAEFEKRLEAELKGVITPKLDTLGTTQQKVIRDISRLSRHLEDQTWFMAMLIKALV